MSYNDTRPCVIQSDLAMKTAMALHLNYCLVAQINVNIYIIEQNLMSYLEGMKTILSNSSLFNSN